MLPFFSAPSVTANLKAMGSPRSPARGDGAVDAARCSLGRRARAVDVAVVARGLEQRVALLQRELEAPRVVEGGVHGLLVLPDLEVDPEAHVRVAEDVSGRPREDLGPRPRAGHALDGAEVGHERLAEDVRRQVVLLAEEVGEVDALVALVGPDDAAGLPGAVDGDGQLGQGLAPALAGEARQPADVLEQRRAEPARRRPHGLAQRVVVEEPVELVDLSEGPVPVVLLPRDARVLHGEGRVLRAVLLPGLVLLVPLGPVLVDLLLRRGEEQLHGRRGRLVLHDHELARVGAPLRVVGHGDLRREEDRALPSARRERLEVAARADALRDGLAEPGLELRLDAEGGDGVDGLLALVDLHVAGDAAVLRADGDGRQRLAEGAGGRGLAPLQDLHDRRVAAAAAEHGQRAEQRRPHRCAVCVQR